MKVILIIAIVFSGILLQAQNNSGFVPIRIATDGFASTITPMEFITPVYQVPPHVVTTTRKKSDDKTLMVEGHLYQGSSIDKLAMKKYTTYITAQKSFTGNWIVIVTHVDDEEYVYSKSIKVYNNPHTSGKLSNYTHYAEYKNGLLMLDL